jgi:hypothetical protein
MTRVRTTSPMTRNQRRRSSEIPSEVKLRKVVPEVPQSETERGELLEDLQTMGCSGLLEKPWGFKDDQIVRELLDGVSNEFEHSIRATPVRWTEECWWEVYNFSKGGGGMARRKDKYVKDCFRALPSPKDRYAIEDCTDVRHRRVLAFLVPILYPEKPNQITVTMDNTIFGALNGGHVPLIPKVEKIPDTSSKDRFEHICNVLGDGGRTIPGRRLEEVDRRKRKTQPGSRRPHKQKLDSKDAGRGSSGINREDPDVRQPSRRSGGEGGTV